MFKGINDVRLLGHVGNDPVVEVKGDLTFCEVRLATNSVWKDKNGERQSQTEWHTVVFYKPALAKLIEEYVKKGDPLYVIGRLKTNSWTGQDGSSHYKTRIIAEDFQFMSGLNSGRVATTRTEQNDNFSDDIPF